MSASSTPPPDAASTALTGVPLLDLYLPPRDTHPLLLLSSAEPDDASRLALHIAVQRDHLHLPTHVVALGGRRNHVCEVLYGAYAGQERPAPPSMQRRMALEYFSAGMGWQLLSQHDLVLSGTFGTPWHEVMGHARAFAQRMRGAMIVIDDLEAVIEHPDPHIYVKRSPDEVVEELKALTVAEHCASVLLVPQRPPPRAYPRDLVHRADGCLMVQVMGDGGDAAAPSYRRLSVGVGARDGRLLAAAEVHVPLRPTPPATEDPS